MIVKILILLLVVGVIFGWDKVFNLFKAFFQAKREFKRALNEEEEERAPQIKVVKK
ncbi:twin-arginine translocase TatA/TatE family subunit [Thermovibrio sp.]